MAPGDLLTIGAGLGLMTGLVEVADFGVRRLLLDQFTGRSVQVVWMAPLGYAVLFLMVGGIVVLVGRWVGRSPNTVVTFLFTFLACLGLAFLYGGRLHRIALVVLAAGVAAQIARMVARRPDAVVRLTRRALPVVAITVGVLAAGICPADHSEPGAIGAVRRGLYPGGVHRAVDAPVSRQPVHRQVPPRGLSQLDHAPGRRPPDPG
jgi:hypothetical protein